MSENVLENAKEDLDELKGWLAPDLELLRQLGKGSVARVYLAREPALKRLVAVKVLRRELAGDDVLRRRFEREAQAAAGIRHPNVVAVHRVGRLPTGVPFIVMEYVEGRTLDELLHARGPLDVREAKRVLGSVASALAAAHRKGVVHRDVRPGNVLQETESGRIVLMDFGIAALLETGDQAVSRLTQTGQVVGDPQHMSPEQLKGEPLTEQSDVYGLGVLAFELLTGAGPFANVSRLVGMQRKLTESTPVLSLSRPDVDSRLSEIVAACLRMDPSRRLRVSEVADALGLATTPVASDPAHSSHDVFDTLGLRAFGRELHQRRVYRTGAAYLAAAFILLQGAQLVLDGLPLENPELWYQRVTAVTLAGFPVVLVLSWLFDVSTTGLRRPARVREASDQRWYSGRYGRLVLPGIGLLISVSLAFLAWRWLAE